MARFHTALYKSFCVSVARPHGVLRRGQDPTTHSIMKICGKFLPVSGKTKNPEQKISREHILAYGWNYRYNQHELTPEFKLQLNIYKSTDSCVCVHMW